MKKAPRSVLFVGHCCIDDIYHVLRYPVEDSTVGSKTTHNRCTKQSWERGGNASNSASILGTFGQSLQVEYFGVLANDNLLKFLQNDMDSYGIIHANSIISPCGQSPTSVVLCSEETGSRTIVHNNGNLPEVTYEQFCEKVKLANYDWIHFEGRNEIELAKILSYVQEYNSKNALPESDQNVLNYKRKKLPISVEVEKQRESLYSLLPLADVAFIGKDFSSMKGATGPDSAAQLFMKILPKGILVICPWGELGASFGIAGHNLDTVRNVPAYPPPGRIVDSLGAGDTFNSGVIYGLIHGWDPEKSVHFGCKIAGAKLGIHGFRDIQSVIKDLPELGTDDG